MKTKELFKRRYKFFKSKFEFFCKLTPYKLKKLNFKIKLNKKGKKFLSRKAYLKLIYEKRKKLKNKKKIFMYKK